MTCSHFNGVLQIPVYRQGRWRLYCPVCQGEHPAESAVWPEAAGEAAALAVHHLEERRFAEAGECFRRAGQITGDPRCQLAILLCRLGLSWCGDEHQPTFAGVDLPRAPLAKHPCILTLQQQASRFSREELQGTAMLLKQLQPILDHLHRQEGLAACDVFLCYRRTPAHVKAALKLHKQLTDLGLNVFCADVTTRGLTQEEFESRVFHALRTAEYMVIFPGDGEVPVSPWMYNEIYRAACEKSSRFVCCDGHADTPVELGTVMSLQEITQRLISARSECTAPRLWERALQALSADGTLPQALRLLERGSAHGDLRARLLLATLYDEGLLLTADQARASHYRTLAKGADAPVRQAVFTALDAVEAARHIACRRPLVCIAADVSTAGLEASRALLQQLLTSLQSDRRLAGCEVALIGYDRHARIIEQPKPLSEYGLPEIAARHLHTLRDGGRDQEAYAAKGLRLCAALPQEPCAAGLLPAAVLLTPRATSDAPAAVQAARESVRSVFANADAAVVRCADDVPDCIAGLLAALR